MANEITIDYASGHTLYAVIRNRTGEVWCAVERTFEDWGAGGRTMQDYSLPLTDKGGSRYIGDFDPNVPAGQYRIQLFVQAGASPANGDAIIASRDIAWTGTGELTALKILANKAVQDKITGVIDYYDDDEETVIMTHTPQDGAATITRTLD